MSKWSDFYKRKMNEVYYKHVCNKYARFINEINKETEKCSFIAEVGCGMGNITRALIEQDMYSTCNDYYVLDSDREMLRLCEKNLANTRKNVKMFHADVRNLHLMGDIVHSHGLLEHFNDEDIIDIINWQKSQFKKLFHYVPSSRYNAPSFGDERLLTKEEWQNICNPDEIVEFNEGYDLVLIWR